MLKLTLSNSKTEITERNMAFHPDYRTPFVDIQDVHVRLACYHIFNSKLEPEEGNESLITLIILSVIKQEQTCLNKHNL